MIPSLLAREVRASVLDYLRTTFAFSDETFEKALFDFLESERGLFKGPYLDIRLPFRRGSREEIPLEFCPPFPPYAHQLTAFHRLHTTEGHQPQHTLITTGTGSGKTECFLYPILDHCLRHRDEPGIKAIILYPMNALATDQARRFAMEINSDALRGKVTAGLYVGGEGTHGVSSPKHLIDKREILRQDPPDILLTNYKMLDFLLLRPEDRGLWAQNGPKTLQYLVLDELHTYDGAQGSDVACLIRRLRARLNVPKWGFACVGTSATIGGRGKEVGAKFLCEFAGKVFGVPFTPEDLVGEDRQTADEAFSNPKADGEDFEWSSGLHRVPEPSEVESLDHERFDSPEAYLKEQIVLWTGEADLTRLELAERLKRHSFLRTLIIALEGEPQDYCHLVKVLSRLEPGFAALSEDTRARALDSFVSVVAHARIEGESGSGLEPFLTCQVQLWVRELRRLVQRVPRTDDLVPVFGFHDDLDRGESDDHYLLVAHCAECGGHGLASIQREGEAKLIDAPAVVGRRWLKDKRECRYIVPNPPPAALNEELFSRHLNPSTLELREGADGPDTVPVLVSPQEAKKTYNRKCPECGTDYSLGILGARAASLLSVGITQLFQSDFNENKKLLAFVDSVQDASHRAAFFGARTYRFNIRTAIQRTIEAGGAKVPLSKVADQILDHARLSLDDRTLIATLTPPDLKHSDEYEDFQARGGKGDNRKVLSMLRRRLSWEATAEYGFNALRGRTLERTGCSVAYPQPSKLNEAVQRLAMDVNEQRLLSPLSGRSTAITEARLRHFLSGVLRRLRIRGGIVHELLEKYLAQGGKAFCLSKRMNPLFTPTAPRSRRPRFLHSFEQHQHFDTFVSAPGTESWHRDFAARTFELDKRDDQINDFLRKALARLTDVGILAEIDTLGKGRAYGIVASALDVHIRPQQVRCDTCGRATSVPEEELSAWAGQSCLLFRCTGRLQREKQPVASYYRRIYRSGVLRRIFSAEHTGLLLRSEREDLEARFKATANHRAPDAPNLLVATPTLEMGIDIGDLSAVTLCAIPPATANYLQRVGRAGRKTGNAFTFTMALAMPKDLYFFASPKEMLAGEVLPPGAFLDAPYMLYRQLVAFAMDRWARETTEVNNIPKEVRYVLGESGKRFPGKFIEHYQKHQKSILKDFLKLFSDKDISDETREKIKSFASLQSLPVKVTEAFERVRTERKELKNLQKRLEKRRQEIEANPALSGDIGADLKDIDDNIKVLSRVIGELVGKYPLNTLTDEGVLPNYSFPEPGVTLKSVIRKKSSKRSAKGKDDEKLYEAVEYQRPASSAIRELAPFNKFYADGRKIEIDEIDIGNKARPLLEQWRFCPKCHYSARVYEGASAVSSECPRCHCSGWADKGQVRTMVHFRRAQALTHKLASVAADDLDDRDQNRYEVMDLIDVGPANWREAQVIESLPFGVEFLRDVALREVNFGFTDSSPGGHIDVAGAQIPEQGFVVCEDCGRVKEPGSEREIRHTLFCKFRKAEALKESVHDVYLYRQVVSEAIRVLLPISTVEVESSRASFKAALDLGFRLRFRGNPQHLLIRSVSEPLSAEGADRRHFLMIYDGVPGGTGYLPGLWKQEAGKGTGLIGVLRLAYENMLACECRKSPERDGCHRCVFAYQSQRDLPNVSRKRALDLLRPILDREGEMKPIATLSQVSLDDRLESELEVKFRDALRNYALSKVGVDWEESIYGGKLAWKLRFHGGPTWQIEPQVDLGYAQGVHKPCRPDFLIRAIAGAPGVKPVAVFCDGFAFHALPKQSRGRIYDDVEKRQALVDSENYVVWSVTWKDIESFVDAKAKAQSPQKLLSVLSTDLVKKALRVAGVDSPFGSAGPNPTTANPVGLLLQYLKTPDQTRWSAAASVLAATAVIWGHSSQKAAVTELDKLESRITTKSQHFTVLPEGYEKAADGTPPVVGCAGVLPWAVFFGRAPTSKLKFREYEEARIYLRLFDEQAARQQDNFESSWWQFLSSWNWLQFHSNLRVCTSEGLVHEGVQPVETGDLLGSNSAEASKSPSALENSELQEVLGLITDQTSRDLVLELLQKQGELPEPVLDVTSSGRVLGFVELAWADKKVAVATSEQEDVANHLRTLGWSVYTPDVSVAELEEALNRGAE